MTRHIYRLIMTISMTDDEKITFMRATKHLASRENVTDVLIKGFIKRTKAVGVKSPKALFIDLIKKETGFKGLGKLKG